MAIISTQTLRLQDRESETEDHMSKTSGRELVKWNISQFWLVTMKFCYKWFKEGKEERAKWRLPEVGLEAGNIGDIAAQQDCKHDYLNRPPGHFYASTIFPSTQSASSVNVTALPFLLCILQTAPQGFSTWPEGLAYPPPQPELLLLPVHSAASRKASSLVLQLPNAFLSRSLLHWLFSQPSASFLPHPSSFC